MLVLKQKEESLVICIQVFSTTEVSVFSSNGLDNTTSFTYRRIGVCLIMVPFKSHSSQRLLIVLRTSNIGIHFLIINSESLCKLDVRVMIPKSSNCALVRPNSVKCCHIFVIDGHMYIQYV